jgi:2-dehydro-3-deoxyglucarate aldolase/4-hydroxy-2-oxoheptanedioate aldolase
MWKENILRKLLNEGKPTIGTHIIIPWPGMFEIIGNSGAFDYVEYVAEYSDWDLPMIANIGRTMELFPKMSLMIKVEEQAKGFLTTRAVDAGFQSVLFTDIRSAEALRDSIRYIRVETLEDGGIHGCGMRRYSGGYGATRDTSKWPQYMR